MPKCLILVGPPCSGKSTFAKDQGLFSYGIISCDSIRTEMSNGKYKFSRENEKKVWAKFYSTIKEYTELKLNILIDNTSCKMKYINNIKNNLPENYTVEYKLFDVSLWKLYLRNYWRKITTGKWIPMKVIYSMKNNFDNLKVELWTFQFELW